MQGPEGPAGPVGPAGRDGVVGPTGSITGSVCAGTTATGLVYIKGRAFTAITTPGNSFTLSRIPAGTYTVTAEGANGATPASMTVTVGAGAVAAGALCPTAVVDPNACGNQVCGGATPICNTANNTCVACLVNSQCQSGQTCTNNTCVWPCGAACPAATPICLPALRRCVQCNTNSDCKNPATPICTGFKCVSLF